MDFSIISKFWLSSKVLAYPSSFTSQSKWTCVNLYTILFLECDREDKRTATNEVQYIASPGYPKYRNNECYTWTISPKTQPTTFGDSEEGRKCVQLKFLNFDTKRQVVNETQFNCTLNDGTKDSCE